MCLLSLILFNLFIDNILYNYDKHCVHIEKEIKIFNDLFVDNTILIVFIKKMKLCLLQFSKVRYNKTISIYKNIQTVYMVLLYIINRMINWLFQTQIIR